MSSGVQFNPLGNEGSELSTQRVRVSAFNNLGDFLSQKEYKKDDGSNEVAKCLAEVPADIICQTDFWWQYSELINAFKFLI
jgi:hypothetical protein